MTAIDLNFAQHLSSSKPFIYREYMNNQMKNINRHILLFPFFIGYLLFYLLSAPLLAEDHSTRVEGQVQRLAPITVTAERIPEYVKRATNLRRDSL